MVPWRGRVGPAFDFACGNNQNCCCILLQSHVYLDEYLKNLGERECSGIRARAKGSRREGPRRLGVQCSIYLQNLTVPESETSFRILSQADAEH